MEHVLKLQPRFFNYIKNGTKRVELRLYQWIKFLLRKIL